MRRGLIIHQSPPAFWVKTSRTTQDTVNQEDTQGHPQRAQANHGTDTPSTPKAQTHTETNPHQPKAGKQWVNTRNLSATLFTGGNQSPRTQTPPSTGLCFIHQLCRTTFSLCISQQIVYTWCIPTKIWFDNTLASEGYNEINNSLKFIHNWRQPTNILLMPKRADVVLFHIYSCVDRRPVQGQHSVYAFHSKLLLGLFLRKNDLTILLHEITMK